MRHSWATYETPHGIGAVVESSTGVCGLILPAHTDTQVERLVAERWDSGTRQAGSIVVSSLEAYFTGDAVDFGATAVDLEEFGDFDRLVYRAVASIPYGASASYGDIALEIGHPGAARAVGNAMAKNPMPIIIPCHRVLYADGRIGGWSGMEGWKERLLALEGILVA